MCIEDLTSAQQLKKDELWYGNNNFRLIYNNSTINKKAVLSQR